VCHPHLANREFLVTVDEEIQDTSMGRPHVVILGAGASVAAFPHGEKNGIKLPVMINLVDTLDLRGVLSAHDVDFEKRNFEDIYSEAHASGNDKVIGTIEDRVKAYFARMELPEYPTIYDHLVLSLREKDVIATFNWDPFLYAACARNYTHAKLPHILFLHGNVAIGCCDTDRVKGMVGTRCQRCGQQVTPSRLLFPVKQKNYTADPYIHSEWETLRQALRHAYMVTIFGYGAPTSDLEAVQLMKEAWGDTDDRNLEEVEVIDIKTDEELRHTWKDFIHSHHYRTVGNFYDSWIANHPRRTCEAMWNQLMEVQYLKANPVPRSLDFLDLWNWYKPLLSVEQRRA
jgi:hypothetical protein